MNYTAAGAGAGAPTFHFQRGDELFFQQQILQDMLVSPSPVKLDKNRRQNLTVAVEDEEENDNRSTKKKKIMHRDVERQRRQEMAMLYSKLRSLLPLEYLKGKRSISDHMNEASIYIRHQQKKIQEMKEKRDGLRRVLFSSNSGSGSGSTELRGGSNQGSSPFVVTIRPCWAGVEAIISSGSRDGVLISKVLGVLAEEEGLSVVSCLSTTVNELCIHTIQCEVDDLRRVDLCGLQLKLTNSIQPSNWVHSERISMQ